MQGFQFIDQKVTKDGHPVPAGQCGYNTETRAEWLIKSLIGKHTDTFVKQAHAMFDNMLKDQINEKLKKTVASAMLKSVNIDKILTGQQD